MRMRYLIIPFVLLVSAVVCGAQVVKNADNKVDFTGRWVSETIDMSADSGRNPRNKDLNLKIEMAISRSANELSVKETTTGTGKFSRDSVYYLDGRGESNKGFTDEFVYETKTTLKDNKLFIVGTIRSQDPNGLSIRSEEEWELSADGKTLKIKSKTSSIGTVRYTKVFRLAS